MADVSRSVRNVQEIAYAVEAEGVRKALCAWLYDEHEGVFTAETTVEIHEDGSATVTTPFPVREAAA